MRVGLLPDIQVYYVSPIHNITGQYFLSPSLTETEGCFVRLCRCRWNHVPLGGIRAPTPCMGAIICCATYDESKIPKCNIPDEYSQQLSAPTSS